MLDAMSHHNQVVLGPLTELSNTACTVEQFREERQKLLYFVPFSISSSSWLLVY
jgi:hypothetical protein